MRIMMLFTRDLRTHDHPALAHAAAAGHEVVPAFVLDDALLRRSPNRGRFLLESLVDLDVRLRTAGAALHVRRGSATDGAVALAVDLRCDEVYMTSDVTALAAARTAELRRGLAANRIGLRLFAGNSIVEPGEVGPTGGGAYRIFAPYWRRWRDAPKRPVLPAPRRLRSPADVPSGAVLHPGDVIPDSLDLPVGGESRGRRRLHAFVRDELDRYGTGRDDLDANETSRLSPYLRFGCISANEAAARAAAPTSPSTPASAEAFVRQLCWRDFFRQLLAPDPAREWKDLRPGPRVASPPSEFALDSWTNGATGIPLVDAGMRQLRREGWIHNRARLVVASFLTRRLGIRWQAGAAHFLHWLVDGDPANNAGGWQWTAGTGTDPRRSRAFNPVRQARRYDPGGRYVRRYVGELADAPPSVIMAPWRDPEFLRSSAYPPPIVDVPDG